MASIASADKRSNMICVPPVRAYSWSTGSPSATPFKSSNVTSVHPIAGSSFAGQMVVRREVAEGRCPTSKRHVRGGRRAVPLLSLVARRARPRSSNSPAGPQIRKKRGEFACWF